MGELKKRDLEIVFNILWKNKPVNADDRSTLVGMNDIPTTTLTLGRFKSYLLKNLGSSGEDIKISFMDYDDMEVPIISEKDFSLALYSFRKRARVGEVITLTLEKVDNRFVPLKKVVVGDETVILPANTEVKRVVKKKHLENGPPEWFLSYMKYFKKEMMEEFSLILYNMKSKTSSHHSKKRMHSKEMPGYSKLEHKLENKLEKLEHKTMKIKAKKMALKCSSDSDAGRSSNKTSRLIGQAPVEIETLMNATVLEPDAPVHMLGGDTYIKKWSVFNSGKLPWTENTDLRYAWGSELMAPLTKTVSCPKLNPGEKGSVSVTLHIPETPGIYECYWHFCHLGQRFGHWLGFNVIVDDNKRVRSTPFASTPKKTIEVSSPKQTDEVKLIENPSLSLRTAALVEDVANSSDSEAGSLLSLTRSNSQSSAFNCDYVIVNNENDEAGPSFVKEIDIKKPDEKVDDTDTVYIYYNGEKLPFNEKYINETYLKSMDAKKEKDVVEAKEIKEEKVTIEEKEIKEEKIIKEEKAVKEEKPSPVPGPSFLKVEEIKEERGIEEKPQEVKVENADDIGYIYYMGEKYPFNKKQLKDSYLKSLANDIKEEKPIEVPVKETPIPTQKPEKRLFMFPQSSPGFEVVQPVNLTMKKSQEECFVTDGLFRDFPNTYTEEKNDSQNDSNFGQSFHEVPNFNSSVFNNCGSINIDYPKSETPSTPRNFETERPDSGNVIPCPYSFQEHTLAGCSSTNCNVSNQSEDGESQHSDSTTKRKDKANTPENFISGAAILATSAMSAARSIMNKAVQRKSGHWANGHWVSEGFNMKMESCLQTLYEMGFLNHELNVKLLNHYNYDMEKVVYELLEYSF